MPGQPIGNVVISDLRPEAARLEPASGGRDSAADSDYLAAQWPISKTTVFSDGVALSRDCAILSLESDIAFPGLFAIDNSLPASSRKIGAC